MNAASNSSSSASGPEPGQPSAVEQAIRARALRAIEQEQAIPPVPASRRVLIIVMTLAALCVVVYGINWVVAGMQRIMDIWYPGSITDRYSQPEPMPGAEGSTQPFAITVVPAEGSASSSVSE